jgi:DNA repair exonuclease SbcCD ATPase subunit
MKTREEIQQEYAQARKAAFELHQVRLEAAIDERETKLAFIGAARDAALAELEDHVVAYGMTCKTCGQTMPNSYYVKLKFVLAETRVAE